MFKQKPKKVEQNKLLRYLINFWTPVLYILIIADFFMRNGLAIFIGPVCTVYVATLSIFSAEKEFERWHDYNIGRHPGEIYVFIWTLLIATLLVLEVIYHETYTLPESVFATYIVVVGILAITRKSKSNYCKTHKVE